MKIQGKWTVLGLVGLTLGLVAATAALVAPAAVAGPPPCQTKNVRTGVEYKGASPLTSAITDAVSGDTINVYGTCYGNFTLSKDLTLHGQGKKATLNGGGSGTVLHVTNGTTTVDGLTITNGVADVESVEGNGCCVGGGIAVSGDTAGAHLVNSLVTGNSASIFGGGIDVDDGTLTLENSTVNGNTASSSGGIDSDFGTVTLIDSTVSGNTAAGGTTCQSLGSCAGGIWNFGGTLTLIDSSISGNTATRRGGGIVNQTPTGGPTALLTLSGTTSITDNHAITDPAVNLGGGIWIRGGATINATADWTGSVSGNTPDQCSPNVTIGSTTCSA
jgi:nitrous oxidase accessory protein NosD